MSHDLPADISGRGQSVGERMGWLLAVGALLVAVACGTSDTVGSDSAIGSTADAGPDGTSSAPPVEAEESNPNSEDVTDASEDASTATTTPSTSERSIGDETTTSAGADGAVEGVGVTGIDWWGCWRAADAVGAGGTAPGDGQRVAVLPNCADGAQSIGAAGDMSHPSDPPIFRRQAANGQPSIEFTFEGDTLLQTNDGRPWSGPSIMAPDDGVTLAWVGTMTDVNSHDTKYLVTGLSDDHEYPQLLVIGEGANRFTGWMGGPEEIHSTDEVIVDDRIVGVLMFFDGENGRSTVQVDGGEARTGVNSRARDPIAGLTLGNNFGRNFSTTDHQFVFLGLYQGTLTEADQQRFWAYVEELR